MLSCPCLQVRHKALLFPSLPLPPFELISSRRTSGDILNIISPDLPSFIHSTFTSAPPSPLHVKLEDPCPADNEALFRSVSTSTVASSTDTPPARDIVFSTAHPENFIIFHPDLLLPNTTISTSLACPRKSVMSGLVKTRYVRIPSAFPPVT